MFGITAVNIFQKLGFPLLVFAAGSITGIGLQQRVLSPKPVVNERKCPDCNCPSMPAAVNVQPFDVHKIKNLRSFTYSPAFTGTISVAGVDSSSVKRYLNEAVMKAFNEKIKTVKK